MTDARGADVQGVAGAGAEKDAGPRRWVRVLGPGGLDDGQVTTVHAGPHIIALSRRDGCFGALDNRCPHQGGPLGEGTIEDGVLRCPWHGFTYDPITGVSALPHAGTAETYPVEDREDGVWVSIPDDDVATRTVADTVVDTLLAWDVRHVFGMVGHSNLGLADALRRAQERGDLTFVGIRHEGAAAFAASAIGKLTGRPAACFAIAGPGSTNLLTGLYDAKADRAPVIALSGQVPSKVLGRGAFQDVDLSGAFKEVAVTTKTVLPGSDHSELVAQAIKTAIVERGVGHLVMPDEVQVQPAEDEPIARPAGRMPVTRVGPPEEAVADARAHLARARRPVIIVGYGAREAMSEIIALAEHLGAPMLTTFKAKGQLPDSHPLACGVLGRSGTPVAAGMMNEADLLLVFGASFSHHTGIADHTPTVQVDTDPMVLGRFHPVQVPVLGDCALTATALRTGDTAGGERADQAAEVATRWADWRAEKARRAARDRGHGVGAAAVFAALGRHAPADAVISVDVGDNAYAFGRYFECERQAVLMSGYLGSIGFGYPAAIGAAVAAPDRRSIAVTGDGGFGQYLAELTTAVAHDLPIVHVLLDNSELGKISREQRAEEMEVWQTSLRNPDFAAYAQLCGALGIRVDSADDLDDALARALAHDGPSLVHVIEDGELD